MYVNNPNYDLSITSMNGYDIKALGTGGVFMFDNIKTVSITGSNF